MARFFVRSFPQPGFDGVFTPHRFWPKDGTFIETVDEDECPHENVVRKSDGTVTAYVPKTTDDGAVLVGRSTLKMLQEDTRFAVGLEGSDVDRLQKLAAENERLAALVAELQAAASTGADAKKDAKGAKAAKADKSAKSDAGKPDDAPPAA